MITNVLDEISHKLPEMIQLLTQWANINSFSHHSPGLNRMATATQEAFSRLEPDEIKQVPFSNGKGLHLQKRKNAPLQILLMGHTDTVFPPDSPFQKVQQVTHHELLGPGVVDMKGGLVVMLESLVQFEQLPISQNVGWQVVLNPDEEIGSIYSANFLSQCAKKSHLALIFEPTLPNSNLVSSRKGICNFLIQSQGKAAHAGRDPEKGKNAIFKLAKFITDIETLENLDEGISLNVGMIEGGVARNIIPEAATCSVSIRANTLEQILALEEQIQIHAHQHHLTIEKVGSRPPKPLDFQTQALTELLTACGKDIGQRIEWEHTGGVCDGNTLAAYGIPTLDTLGVEGRGLHTGHETLFIPSLIKKTQLMTYFLMELANGKFSRPL